MEEELQAEIEFLEDKIIGLEKKNEELLTAINRLKLEHKADHRRREMTEQRYNYSPRYEYQDYYGAGGGGIAQQEQNEQRQNATALQRAAAQMQAQAAQAYQDALLRQGTGAAGGGLGTNAGLQGGLQNAQTTAIPGQGGAGVTLTVDMIQNAINLAADRGYQDTEMLNEWGGNPWGDPWNDNF